MTTPHAPKAPAPLVEKIIEQAVKIACDHLVVAAGPQAEGLLAPAGIRLPLAAARAEMIVPEP